MEPKFIIFTDTYTLNLEISTRLGGIGISKPLSIFNWFLSNSKQKIYEVRRWARKQKTGNLYQYKKKTPNKLPQHLFELNDSDILTKENPNHLA